MLEDAINRLAAATEKLVTVQEQIFAAVAGRPSAPAGIPGTGASAPATAASAGSGPTLPGGPGGTAGPAAPRARRAAAAPAAPGAAPAGPSGPKAPNGAGPSAPGPAAASGPVGPGASAPGKIKYDTVREAVLGCAERKGALVAQKVLSDHGVTHGKELKADQYQSVLTAVETAMGEADYAAMMQQIQGKGAPALA